MIRATWPASSGDSLDCPLWATGRNLIPVPDRGDTPERSSSSRPLVGMEPSLVEDLGGVG